jgi:hypothetical protein
MRLKLLTVGCLLCGISSASAQIYVPQILSVEQIRDLETRVAQVPDNAAAVKLLAGNYALVILGVTALGSNGIVEMRDPALAASEFASHAREALRQSQLPGLLGEAANSLGRYRMGGARAMMPPDLRNEAGQLQGQLLDRAISLDPKNAEWRRQRIELTILNANFSGVSVEDSWSRVKEDLAAMSGNDRMNSLPRVAMLAERAGKLDDAAALARELLRAGDSGAFWSRGDALHTGNTVLGKVSLDKGDPAAAESYLIQSAATIPEGSPVLKSFGPNMSLALALMKAGHEKAVLQYFELCRVFWKRGGPSLDKWTAEVKEGRTPQFGGNLFY